jgi:putative aldouronate transport system permease protein
MEKPSRLGLAGKVLAIVVVVILVLYPFWVVIADSISSNADIARNSGIVLFPLRPTMVAYSEIFGGGIVTRAVIISVCITAIGTVLSLAATVAMAYGLSRRDLVGGRFLLMVALLTLLFSPGIIPNFLVVKQLGLLNNFASLILPVLISAFNLVVLRAFFMGLPGELFDAARLDGAGDLRILMRLVLPLSKGVLAVITLFYAVGYWNAFFNAMLYMNSNNYPLSMILREYALLGEPVSSLSGAVSSSGAAPEQALQSAVVVLALIPILLVYPMLQRYFTKGVLTGAIKGLQKGDYRYETTRLPEGHHPGRGRDSVRRDAADRLRDRHDRQGQLRQQVQPADIRPVRQRAGIRPAG